MQLQSLPSSSQLQISEMYAVWKAFLFELIIFVRHSVYMCEGQGWNFTQCF